MKFYAILVATFLTITLCASPTNISTHIKTDQFGYRQADAKIAIIAQPQMGFNAPSSYTPGSTFKIRRWSDDVEVFSGSIAAWNGGSTHTQSGDKVWWFDFSNLTTAGEYYVYDPTNNIGSYKFMISNDVFTSVLMMASKALFYQRCGTNISATHGGHWTHSVCHINSNQDILCRDVENPNNSATAKDLSGGWHDAGDYNKYVNFTYSTVHNLLFAYQENPSVFADNWGIPESGNGIPDILDEVKYELDWLIKMQQTDGSVLSKVSVTDFSSASPPSGDGNARYWGRASTSSTLTVASLFAHASVVFNSINNTYATSLKNKAELAWTWAVANPNVTFANTGFQSADPEVSSYDSDARKTCAAAMLYSATNNSTYKTYFENNYTNLHPYAWYYFYTFEGTYGDIALYYTSLSGITSSVASNILSRFNTSTNSNGDFYPNFTNQTDAYRAYMKDNDYAWGNNMQKSLVGVMYESMIKYNQTPANHTNYRIQALDFLHFLHGTNPLSIVMLSNSGSIGADNYATQIYHGWTGDGSVDDLNPIPGLITGGFNGSFTVSTISPPAGQPIQKSYKDWNTSWPENSWEITEPAIYYQAAYIRLVSKYATTNVVLPVELTAFEAKKKSKTEALLTWEILTASSIDYFSVEKSIDNQHFETIGTVKKAETNVYEWIDKTPRQGLNYYRLKMMDKEGKYHYSAIKSLLFEQNTPLSISPNPATHTLKISMPHVSAKNIMIEIFDDLGHIVVSKKIQNTDLQKDMQLDISSLSNGVYHLKLTYGSIFETKSFAVAR
ncbi:MAG: glycoside hydrolase family 9 protein [Saprospiraceae bacterium]|nr:glycoside hydrolase family 9 protein [Saprospiraceae bacterium]